MLRPEGLPPVQYEVTPLQGGYDQITSAYNLTPGALRDCINFACRSQGGYYRIPGYERIDGQPAPSDASFLPIDVTMNPDVSKIILTTIQTKSNLSKIEKQLERLIDVGYIERDARALVPTEKGMNVIRLLGEHPLTSPSLTGDWEKQLAAIEEGTVEREKFMGAIAKFAEATIAELRASSATGSRATGATLVIPVVAITAQLVLGDVGWFERYQAWLIATAGVALVLTLPTVRGTAPGRPALQPLAGRAAELRDVSIYTAVTVPPVPEVIKYPESFRYMDWQWSKLTRIMHSQFEVAYYSPILYHRAPFAYRYLLNQDAGEKLNKGYRSVNYDKPESGKTKWISIVRVAPMDKSGLFNLGPQNSETSAKIEGADCVIVEVVKNMPICLGGSEEAVHISRVDYIVEAPDDHGCFATPDIPPSDVDQKIAAHVMRYIHDGCCIQLGIGGMPNMVGKLIAQSDLKHLGCHTEMFVAAYPDMIESGRMDGSRGCAFSLSRTIRV